MFLFTLAALADPAPPQELAPIGYSIEDGATDVPVDAVPLLVYPSNAILPATLSLTTIDSISEVTPLEDGPYDTPTQEVDVPLEPNTMYTLSSPEFTTSFTTGTGTTAPAPAAGPSLAQAVLTEPGGETGSGFYWTITAGPFTETVYFYVDNELIRVHTPELGGSFQWSRSTDTVPFCAHLRTRTASGELSEPGEALCFANDLPTNPPPTGEPTDTPTPTDDEEVTAGGCSVAPGLAFAGAWILAPLLLLRRRG